MSAVLPEAANRHESRKLKRLWAEEIPSVAMSTRF